MPPENKILMVQKNKEHAMDGELAELCKMMRIMSDRDTDGTLPQVLKILMIESRGKPVGGSDLSRASGINRITIIHHLKRLEGAGLVRRQEGKYILRVSSAEGMLVEFRKEMEQHFSEMDEIARQIDSQLLEFEREIEARRRRIR